MEDTNMNAPLDPMAEDNKAVEGTPVAPATSADDVVATDGQEADDEVETPAVAGESEESDDSGEAAA